MNYVFLVNFKSIDQYFVIPLLHILEMNQGLLIHFLPKFLIGWTLDVGVSPRNNVHQICKGLSFVLRVSELVKVIIKITYHLSLNVLINLRIKRNCSKPIIWMRERVHRPQHMQQRMHIVNLRSQKPVSVFSKSVLFQFICVFCENVETQRQLFHWAVFDVLV